MAKRKKKRRDGFYLNPIYLGSEKGKDYFPRTESKMIFNDRKRRELEDKKALEAIDGYDLTPPPPRKSPG